MNATKADNILTVNEYNPTDTHTSGDDHDMIRFLNYLRDMSLLARAGDADGPRDVSKQ